MKNGQHYKLQHRIRVITKFNKITSLPHQIIVTSQFNEEQIRLHTRRKSSCSKIKCPIRSGCKIFITSISSGLEKAKYWCNQDPWQEKGISVFHPRYIPKRIISPPDFPLIKYLPVVPSAKYLLKMLQRVKIYCVWKIINVAWSWCSIILMEIFRY